MKIVIAGAGAGAGSVGRYMAAQLQQTGHEVILLDQDPGVLERHGRGTSTITWAEGDGCEIDTLRRIGVADADVVNVGAFVRLLSFAQGRARLAEVTLASGSPAVDRAISQLGLPRESTIVALLRRDEVVVPRGETVLLGGDEVVVLVTGDAEADVRRALVG